MISGFPGSGKLRYATSLQDIIITYNIENIKLFILSKLVNQNVNQINLVCVRLSF